MSVAFRAWLSDGARLFLYTDVKINSIPSWDAFGHSSAWDIDDQQSIWSEWKPERSGPKIKWAGVEWWAGMRKNNGAGAAWSGNGAVSGLNWPLKFCSKMVCYSKFVMLYKLYLTHAKNKLSTGILFPIGLFCFWIPYFDVFVWTPTIIRQVRDNNTTDTLVIITGTQFSGQILHVTFSPFRYQCVNCLYSQ